MGQASLPFLRGGVSRSSLSDARPLTANEKDPSAPLGMTIREEHFSSAHFIRYSGYPSPTLSFRAQREIFLALRHSLLLSQKVSPFPLSHIRRYTSMPERSLDFARDDDTGIAFYKHIRCTLREINPFPHTVISSAARNLPCTLLFLTPFAKGFPFSAVSHRALYQCARKIEDFARDDDTGIAFSKHIRCTLREINPFPYTVISSAVEKSSLHFVLSCSLRKRFPFFRCHTYGAIPVCKKDPSASLGMTLRKWRFPNISVVRYV